MDLLVWLLSSVLLPLFFLLFFFFVSVSLCVFMCSCLINVVFTICVGAFSVCCFRLYFFWNFFFLFYFLFIFLISFFFPSMLCGLWRLGAPENGQAWSSKVEDQSTGFWNTRELLTSWNANQHELSQRPPTQHSLRPGPTQRSAISCAWYLTTNN